MTAQNKRLSLILLSAAMLLLIPFIAMQFTNEVDWTASDFTVMGVLLFGTGLVCEFILRTVKSIEYRLVFIAVALVVLFLIWAELAVGIFGTPLAGS